jgi:hypothetical protein
MKFSNVLSRKKSGDPEKDKDAESGDSPSGGSFHQMAGVVTLAKQPAAESDH